MYYCDWCEYLADLRDENPHCSTCDFLRRRCEEDEHLADLYGFDYVEPEAVDPIFDEDLPSF